MLIVYDTRTKNVQRFVQKLDVNNVQIGENLTVTEPYVLITYTDGFGNVPKSTIQFLEVNHFFMRAIASSGNRNWGSNFAKSADIIAEKFNVPIILKFELSGTPEDVQMLKERLCEIEAR
ncbi:class Ib ribonucleoside-diphosphate reductase assembly flavoprotein NrdI [Brevibacillus brevis X23]|nr:class Ib ribonucleoside-diphosphate reductase assembly flavoprotein NrdI [Brevibacillus brevis X23]